jgi:hypothetical protein
MESKSFSHKATKTLRSSESRDRENYLSTEYTESAGKVTTKIDFYGLNQEKGCFVAVIERF